MAAQKFLIHNQGNFKEAQAVDTSAGVADAGRLIALNNLGKIDITMLPTGMGPDIKSIVASEDLSAGAWVNVYDEAGTVKVRNADATGPGPGKKCDGFVLESVTADASVNVYFEGVNNQCTGLTKGAVYFLSKTAGAGVDAAPSGAGVISQILGKAISATEMSYEGGQPIELLA